MYKKAWNWVRVEVCLPSEHAETEVDASYLDALLKLLYEKDLSTVSSFFVPSWWLWNVHPTGTSKLGNKLSFVLYITN